LVGERAEVGEIIVGDVISPLAENGDGTFARLR
jgi:hypothetical protein